MSFEIESKSGWKVFPCLHNRSWILRNLIHAQPTSLSMLADLKETTLERAAF